MSKFAGLIGRKSGGSALDRSAAGETGGRDDNLIELDQELFSPSGTQLGEENEAVRTLLIDAELRINELDVVKQAFGKLVEPVNKTLRALETTKSEKLGLQNTLNATRIAYGKLRGEHEAMQKRADTLENECLRLQEDLDLAQDYVNTLESTKAELTGELTAKRIDMADLQRQLHEGDAELETTRSENTRISERLAIADKKIVELESELSTTQQKLMLAERDRVAVQSALDESVTESGRLSRRLAELENALAASQSRLRQLEGRLSESETERTKLAQTLDESREKHQNESSTARARLESVQARAAATEKLLDEARQELAVRAEELRTYERRMAEATMVRNVIEGKLGQIESGVAGRDSQIRELEQARGNLMERNDVLSKAVATRETAYNRAQERIGSLEERIELLESELRSVRESSDLQIEELSSQLQRERSERSIAEGALDAARKDVARLMREIATLQQRPASASGSERVTPASSPPSPPERLPPTPMLQNVA